MTFIVSSGEVAGLSKASTRILNSIQVSNGVSQTYAELYRTQSNVRTVVDFLSRNLAQIPLHTFERVSDTDRKRLTDHPLPKLLANPFPGVSRYAFAKALASDLAIYDTSFHIKTFSPDGGVMGLLRVPPTMVTPNGANWFAAESYRVKGTAGFKDYLPEQVVTIHGYNPEDSRIGLSPLESLRRILAEEFEAGNWREQLWRNGARVPGVISRPLNAPAWSNEAVARFTESWKGVFTGNGPGAGGTPVLEDGMLFTASGVTPADAEYLESRKLTRSEVAAAFHVPAPMVGILDDATFSNVTQLHKMLYQDTLGPWLTQIQEEFAVQLIPDFDKTGKLYVEFNISEKLKGSFEEQANQLQSAAGAPYMTRNEVRARVNLPAIEGGDELIVPLNLGQPTDPNAPVVLSAEEISTRINSAGTLIRSGFAPEASLLAVGLSPVDHLGLLPVTVQAPKSAAESAMLSKFFARQGAAVLSAIGAKKDWWDADRWNEELATEIKAMAGTKAVDADGIISHEEATYGASVINEATFNRLAKSLLAKSPTESPIAIFADLQAKSADVDRQSLIPRRG